MAALELSAALALVAAAGIGVAAHVVKYGLSAVSADTGVAPVFAAALVMYAVTVVLFWPIALARGLPPMALPAIAPFLLGGVLYPAVFRLLYNVSLDRVGANVTGAVVAANPALVGLLAVPVLGERFTRGSALGLGLIVAGGALLQLARLDADEATRDVVLRELLAADARDLLPAVGSLATVSVGYVLIKWALGAFPHPLVGTALTQSAAAASFALAAVASGRVRRQLRATAANRVGLGVFLLAGLVIAVVWISQFTALRSGAAVVVVPLINTYPLVIAGISYALARQLPRSPRVLAGIVAIVAGASLVQVA